MKGNFPRRRTDAVRYVEVQQFHVKPRHVRSGYVKHRELTWKQSTTQARERLLSKVKADQERLKQLDARTAETASDIESMKRRLADLDSDMKADKKGDVAQNKARCNVLLFFCSPG